MVLEKEIYFVEKHSKDTGDIIEKYADGEGYQNKMKNLIEEIRVWKDRVRGIEGTFVREETTVENQKERMQTIMKENTELGVQVEAMQKELKSKQDPAGAGDGGKPEDKERLGKEADEVRRKFDEEEKKHKKKLNDDDKNIRELEIKLEEIKKELREKEKENRILNFKISTQKRAIKHNQLKPVR